MKGTPPSGKHGVYATLEPASVIAYCENPSPGSSINSYGQRSIRLSNPETNAAQM